jgi:hypothetical protein
MTRADARIRVSRQRPFWAGHGHRPRIRRSRHRGHVPSRELVNKPRLNRRSGGKSGRSSASVYRSRKECSARARYAPRSVGPCRSVELAQEGVELFTVREPFALTFNNAMYGFQWRGARAFSSDQLMRGGLRLHWHRQQVPQPAHWRHAAPRSPLIRRAVGTGHTGAPDRTGSQPEPTHRKQLNTPGLPAHLKPQRASICEIPISSPLSKGGVLNANDSVYQ